MIYLETSDNEAALRMLQTLKVVKAAKATTKGLTITITADGTHCLPILISKLKDMGIDIKGVNLKEPSLDDVFVHFTGRDIREGGAEKFSKVVTRRGR
jgi:ABC-2 type transport system ATP-binding protein